MLEAACAIDEQARSIQCAIAELPSKISNSIETVRYDFSAILNEIETIKDERQRMELLNQAIQPLFFGDDRQRKHTPCTKTVRTRESMLEESFRLAEDKKHAAFRWLNRLKMLASMKKELALYRDAKPTDDETQKKYLYKFLEDEVARRKAKAPNELIVFSMSVPTPKEWRDASARVGYKNWLSAEIKYYIKDYFDAIRFKVAYQELLPQEQQSLMARVREEIGRYPKWYKDEGETEKSASGQAVKLAEPKKDDVKVDVNL